MNNNVNAEGAQLLPGNQTAVAGTSSSDAVAPRIIIRRRLIIVAGSRRNTSIIDRSRGA